MGFKIPEGQSGSDVLIGTNQQSADTATSQKTVEKPLAVEKDIVASKTSGNLGTLPAQGNRWDPVQGSQGGTTAPPRPVDLELKALLEKCLGRDASGAEIKGASSWTTDQRAVSFLVDVLLRRIQDLGRLPKSNRELETIKYGLEAISPVLPSDEPGTAAAILTLLLKDPRLSRDVLPALEQTAQKIDAEAVTAAVTAKFPDKLALVEGLDEKNRALLTRYILWEIVNPRGTSGVVWDLPWHENEPVMRAYETLMAGPRFLFLQFRSFKFNGMVDDLSWDRSVRMADAFADLLREHKIFR